MSEADIEVKGDEVVVTTVHDGVCIVHEKLFVYIINDDFNPTHVQLVARPTGRLEQLGGRSKLTLEVALQVIEDHWKCDELMRVTRAIYSHMYKQPITWVSGPTGPQGMQGGYGPSSIGPTGPTGARANPHGPCVPPPRRRP